MEYLYSTLIGYFIGCINPSYMIGRLKGVNIKKSGSGNAGASNVLMLFGKVAGLLCALFDIFKAFFAIILTEKLFPELTCALALTGSACMLGHMFPFYMKFNGGKGLASFGGMVLAFDWRVFLVLLALELVFVLIVDYICFVPMTATPVFSVIYGVMTGDVVGGLILLTIALAVNLKHIENIKRIRLGREAHFSFLWRKEEKERLERQLEED